jgi:hypothetical protein
VNGIVVSGVSQPVAVPSTHYGGPLGGAGVSAALRELGGLLVDGKTAAPHGQLEIFAPHCTQTYALIVVWDNTAGAERCFVVFGWTRTANDGLGPFHPQRAAPPQLLDDVLDDAGTWQLYNCRIALREWTKSRAAKFDYPKP